MNIKGKLNKILEVIILLLVLILIIFLESNVIRASSVSSSTTTQSLVDEQKLGNLHIHKVDSLAKNVSLEGVEFKIGIAPDGKVDEKKYIQLKDSSGHSFVGEKVASSVTIDRNNERSDGKYQVEYVSDKNRATIFVTDSDGEIWVNNLEVYYDRETKYKYYAEEISMGDKLSPYYDVKSEVDAEKEEDNLLLEPNKSGKNTDKQILNTQLRVDLKGYVWEDVMEQDGKVVNRDDLYFSSAEKPDSRDIRIANIPVVLKKNGNIIAETTTNDIGEYFFPAKGTYKGRDYTIDLYKDGSSDPGSGLEQYTIEFEYNGLKYESVKKAETEEEIRKDNTSKAGEMPNYRDNIDENFYKIQGNTDKSSDGTTRGKTSTGVDLRYTGEEQYKSKLIQNIGYRADSAEGSIGSTATQSKELILMLANIESSIIRKNWEYGITTVGKLNLGIYERIQTDLSIATDLDNIRFDINGYAHTYYYGMRRPMINQSVDAKIEGEAGYDALMDGFSVQAKNRSGKYKDLSYVREVYPSYIAYSKSAEPDNRLRISITYKIVIKNESALWTYVDKIRNYYDPNFDFVEFKIGDKNTGRSFGSDHVDYGDTLENGNEMIDLLIDEVDDFKIGAFSNLQMYVTYTLKHDKMMDLLKLKVEDGLGTSCHATEILSYSTFDKEDKNKKYASIDKDSAPDNAKYKESETTYEDDTDSAPNLKIKRSQLEKMLTGTVFEDNTGNNEYHQQERKGNGIYDDGENMVQNVKVRLVSKDSESGELKAAKLYTITNDGDVYEKYAEETTLGDGEDKGKYEFKGLIPGVYYLEYTYGSDKTYKTMIESTEVTTQDYKSTIIDGSSNINNLIRRQYVDNYSSDGKWTSYFDDENFKSKDNNDAYWYENEEARTHSAAVDDYAKREAINKQLENIYYELKTEYDDRKITDKWGTLQGDIYFMTSRTPSLSVAIEDRDDKTSTIAKPDVKKQDSSGNQMYDANSNFEGGDPIPNSYETKFGIAERPRQKFKVTKEVSRVKVILANGQILLEGNPTVNQISPYLTYPLGGRLKIEIDNEIIQGAKLELQYEIKVENLSDLNYNYINYYVFGIPPVDDPVKTRIQWIDYLDRELNPSVENDSNWAIVEPNTLYAKGLLQENTSKNNNYNYIQSQISTEVAPGQEGIINIEANKELSTSKDMTYDNKVEFLKASNDVGRFYESNSDRVRQGTPGNNQFDTDKGDTSDDKQDSDNNGDNPERAEVVIVPPTGKAKIYYALGIGCLTLLLGGIVLIKKKVLDSDK